VAATATSASSSIAARGDRSSVLTISKYSPAPPQIGQSPRARRRRCAPAPLADATSLGRVEPATQRDGALAVGRVEVGVAARHGEPSLAARSADDDLDGRSRSRAMRGSR